MDLAAKFKQTNPQAFFLDDSDPQALQAYLIEQGWIEPTSRVRAIAKAGEGNMNKVLRVQVDDGDSFIVKQARPWVEKFPDIAAPAQRADIEGLYFGKTGQNETIAAFSPTLRQADPQSHILMIEDLGKGSDLTGLYAQGTTMQMDTLVALLDYLAALHTNFTRANCDFYIENGEMRALNAEHIFRFPFVEDNGLDLNEITPGLAESAKKYRHDAPLMRQVAMLHARYLQNGDTLVQGDFYPGSFIQTDDGINVIDTEFCFFGDAEFDLGVFYAHLVLARQPDNILAGVLAHYDRPASFCERLYWQYAGVEILRRLLGLAQLPLQLDLENKQALLKRAHAMLTAA